MCECVCLTRLGSNVGTSISPSCVLMCASAPPGLVRITFLYVTQSMGLRQGFRGHFRSLSISSASLAVFYVFLIFTSAPFSSIFRLSLYMYVRVSLGPVGACVRLCFRVPPPADTPSAPRDLNVSSVNAIR